MTTKGRAVPEHSNDGAPEDAHTVEPEDDYTVTVRIPANFKLRDVVALEAAMAQGVGQMVELLVARGICDREELEELDWGDFEDFKVQLRKAIQAAGKIPKKSGRRS